MSTVLQVTHRCSTFAKANQKEFFQNHSVKLVDVDWDTPPKMKFYKEHLEGMTDVAGLLC